jgi:sulfur carrier protein ThiS
MKILFLNHDGGGFADHIEIEEGMTVEALFQSRMKDAKPEEYLIRVNRQPCSAGQQLQEGDRVSITPRKIEGAA